MTGKTREAASRAPFGSWRVVEREGDVKVEHVGRAVFDELHVDAWLHVEQLEDRVWWMRVGDARLTVSIAPDGQPTVDVQRGFYGEVRGDTSEHEVP
jgi:hypothetical protein